MEGVKSTEKIGWKCKGVPEWLMVSKTKCNIEILRGGAFALNQNLTTVRRWRGMVLKVHN